jgi:RHS repeat-associated protein
LIKQNLPGTTGASYGLLYQYNTGNISFSLRTDDTAWADYTSHTVLAMNTWYDVVGVYDGLKVQIYLNGKLDAQYGNVSGNLVTADGDLQMGMEDAWPREYLMGDVRDVGMWNTALSGTEVAGLDANPTAGANSYPEQSNIVAAFDLNEAQGDTVTESTGKGYTGTLYGGTSWVKTVSITTPDLAVGSHTLTVSDNDGTSAGVLETVSQSCSSTVLTTSASTVDEGSPVTLTATVTASTATGAVQFFDGTTLLGTSPVESGSAVLITASMPAGASHTVTATYDGNTTTESSSASVNIDVLPDITPGLTASSSAVVAGQPVTLTASVPSTATGSIQFYDGDSTVGTPQSLTNTGTSALLLDGTYGGVSTTLSLDPSVYPDMTISMWVRIDSFSMGRGIVSCFDGYAGGAWRGFGYEPDGDWMFLVGSDGDWDTGIPAQLANPTSPTGGWHHIVAVFASSNIWFYYDALPAVCYGSGGGYVDTYGESSTLTIGYDGYAGASQFGYGAITEVNVWGASLNAADARQLYNSGVVFASSDLTKYPDYTQIVAGWHFNDAAGYTDPTDGPRTAENFVYRSSHPGDSSQDGTLFGSASWTLATPNPSIATLPVTTGGVSPDLSPGVNSITAVYIDDTTLGRGTSAVVPVTVVADTDGNFLPTVTDEGNISTFPTAIQPADAIPNDGTPSSLSDGSLTMQATAGMGANLNYVSGSRGRPIVSADIAIDPGALTWGITAVLFEGDTPIGQTYYSLTDLTGASASGTFRFAVRPATPLITGRYAFTIGLFETGSTIDRSEALATSDEIDQNVLNWSSSPFGQDWMLNGLDQLYPDESGALLVKSDGTMAYFTAVGDGTFTSPDGPFKFMNLSIDASDDSTSGDYILIGTHGVKQIFNSSGLLRYVFDNDGNKTTYNWTGTTLNSIDASGRTTSFAFSSGSVTITDFAGRATTLTLTSGQLTNIELPDPGVSGQVQPEYNFGYDPSTSLMTSYQDANGNFTNYAFRPDGTLQTETDADWSTVTYQAAQALLFPSGTDGAAGSESNPALLVPNTAVRGVLTNAAGDPTLETFDQFADVTSSEDAAGNLTVSTFTGNGLVSEVVQPSVSNLGAAVCPTTYYTYYSSTDYGSADELATETAPNGAEQIWSCYTTIPTPGGPDEVAQLYTNGLGNKTQYTYSASTADLIETDQYANGSSSSSDNIPVQNTAPGGDPYTTTVYSTAGTGVVGGLPLSTVNPDGDVSAQNYDGGGDVTASFQGQIVGPASSGSDTTWTFAGLELNAARTFDVFVSASVSLTAADPHTSLTITSGTPDLPAASIVGSWTFAGTVNIGADEPSTSITLSASGASTASVCLMECTSTSVYSYLDSSSATGFGPDNLLSTKDAMGNITAYNDDNLDRVVATSQGQVVPASTSAEFINIPQSPGEVRSFEVYVQAASAPDSAHASVSDSGSGSPTFTPYAGSRPAATPLGGNWYDLGTVSILAGDISSTVTVSLAGSSGVTQAAFLEQTSATAYDAMNDVVAQSDGLKSVSTTLVNEMNEPVLSSQGMIERVNSETDSATFSNLPQTPGQPRTFIAYVNALPSFWESYVSENGSDSPTFSAIDAPTTDLGGIAGGNWYGLGMITLAAGDTSSSITIHDPFGSPTQICVVQEGASQTYTNTQAIATQTDADGNLSSVQYNTLQEPVATVLPPSNPAEPASPPVANTVYDTLGDVTAQMSPLPVGSTAAGASGDYNSPAGQAVTAYGYAFADYYTNSMASGTESVSTWQGSIQPPDYGSSSTAPTWTFTNLAVANDIPGDSSNSVTYCVFVQGDSTAGFSLSSGAYAFGTLPSSTLGIGWTLFETVTIADDALSTLVVSHSGSTTAQNVCLLRLTDTKVYNSDSNLVRETDALQNTTTYAYSALSLPAQQAVTGGPKLGPQYDKAANVISDTDLQNGAVTQYLVNMFGGTYSTTTPFADPSSAITASEPTSKSYGDWADEGDGYYVSSDGGTATYTLGPLTTGATYEVLVTWNPVNIEGTNTADASYTIDNGGTSLNASADQQLAPNSDLVAGSQTWQSILTFTAAAGSVTVTVTGPDDGTQVAAAGVKILPVRATTLDTRNADGQLVSETDPMGNTRSSSYDFLGDQVSSSLPDPVTGAAGGPTTYDTYDLDGRVVGERDPAGNLTAFSFDSFGNEISQSLPPPTTGAASPTTTFTFDADRNTLSLTDPVGTTTAWTYTSQGQVATQSQVVALGYNSDGSVNTTNAVDTYQYDAAGDISEAVDADGRAIVFSYSTQGNETGENWYPTAADADAQSGSDGSESFSYDVLGGMAAAQNSAAAYQFQYDTVGHVTNENIVLAGMSGGVTLASTYDFNGNRKTLSATVGDTVSNGTFSGGTADFANTYSYDTLGDLTNIAQAGENGVTPKGVDLTYDADQRVSTIDAWQNATPTQVYHAAYGYDKASELTGLTYTYTPSPGSSTVLAGYHWDYTGNGLVQDEFSYNDTTSGANPSDHTTWAETTFGYDHDSQLTSSSYSTNFANAPKTNLADTFDPNGNRTSTTTKPDGSDATTCEASSTNRLLFDGTYYYQYNANGNRIAKYQSETGALDGTATDITIYGWNEKNEMTSINAYATYADYRAGAAARQIAEQYDAFGNMVSRTPTGISGESPEFFIYDGSNVALILNQGGGVVERELSGQAVDQYFASEAGPASATLSANTVDWLLTDNQGTVRDVVQYNSTTGAGAVVDHLVYDSAGQMTSQTHAAYAPTFTYAGMMFDADAGLYNDGLRKYDAVDAVFASQDPIGFGGGQTNTEVYCGNSPTNGTDPSGTTDFISNTVSDIAGGIGAEISRNTTPTDRYAMRNNLLSMARDLGRETGEDYRYGATTRTQVEVEYEGGHFEWQGPTWATQTRVWVPDHPGVGLDGPHSGGGTGGTGVPIKQTIKIIQRPDYDEGAGEAVSAAVTAYWIIEATPKLAEGLPKLLLEGGLKRFFSEIVEGGGAARAGIGRLWEYAWSWRNADEVLDISGLTAQDTERIEALRAAGGVSRGRNLAIADYSIDGVEDTLNGVSGETSRAGFAPIPAPDARIFATFTDNFPRAFDAEVLILEQIASMIPEDAQGVVEPISERSFCRSCQWVLDQFQVLYPNITLILRGG